MSTSNISGKVHKVIDETGTSKKGDSWNKRTVVVDNGSDFSNLVPIVFFGDKASSANCKEGDTINATFYVGGREWQGKFYADISGNTLEVTGSSNVPPKPQPAMASAPSDEDDLPF